jgi:hypothetical protein
MNRKLQSDTGLDRLPETQRRELISWLAAETADPPSIRERMIAAFGCSASEAMLARFQDRSRRAQWETAAMALAGRFPFARPPGADSDLALATLATLARRHYERAAARGGGTGELQVLARLAEASARAARQERALALAEAKAAQALRVAEAATPGANGKGGLTAEALQMIREQANLI